MFGHANEGFVESPLGALIVSVAEESIGIHRRTQLCGNANSIRLVSAGIGLTRSRINLDAYAGEIIPPREEIGRLGLELSDGVPGLLDHDRHVVPTGKAEAPDKVGEIPRNYIFTRNGTEPR